MDTPREGSALESMGLVLNRALSALSDTMRTPWSMFRPGQIIEPLVSSSEAASQAPTREATPARELAPPAPPARQPPVLPEAIPEEPAQEEPGPEIPQPPEAEIVPARPGRPKPKKPGRKPRLAPPHASDRELNWRRSLHTPDQQAFGPKQGVTLMRRAQRAHATKTHRIGRVGPAAYEAVDAQGRFGLIDCARLDTGSKARFPRAGPGQTLLLAHTPPRRDPLSLTTLREGDTLSVLGTHNGGRARLRIEFMTRSGYVSPGHQITSLLLGVASTDWAHALQGPARTSGI
jgi:hypothetical protein